MNNNMEKLENDDLIEIQFHDNKPNVVGEFKFYGENHAVSHPLSFRLWKSIRFGLPVLIDLPIGENIENSDIYEAIGDVLKRDFIKFLNEK